MVRKKKREILPVHPGEILKTEFMEPLGLSANQLSLHLRVPSGRVTQIINGHRAITADTALRLSRVFGTTAEFWINLQGFYDLQVTEDATFEQIQDEVIPLKKAN